MTPKRRLKVSRARPLALGSSLALIACALAMTSRVEPALAHANLETSNPERGEVVAEMPATIELVFSQEVARSGGLPEVLVVNDSGDQVDLGAALSDDDRTLITVEMPPAMPDGRYTVIWHTLSDEDGEEARGAFDFFVGAAPTPEPETRAPGETAAPTEAPATDVPTNATATEPSTDNGGEEDDGGSDGLPWWALIGGIAAGAAVGFAGGIMAGGRKEKEEA